MAKNKELRAASKKIVELSRFDVSKYEGCAQYDIVDWSESLSFRYLNRGCLLGPERRREAEENYDIGLNLLLQILERPLPTKKLTPKWSAAKSRTIRDVDLFTYWRGRELVEKFPEAAAACSELDRKMDENIDYTSDDTCVIPHSSLHSYILERDEWPFRHTEPEISVCLRASDEQIIAQFSEWLRRKREELKKHGKRDPPLKNFTKSDLARWSENRVLAYIDLEMLTYHLGLVLTDEVIGQKLFPDEYDLGIAEKVRKTVRPMAKRLMDPDVLDAMDWQAGFEYYANH